LEHLAQIDGGTDAQIIEAIVDPAVGGHPADPEEVLKEAQIGVELCDRGRACLITSIS
jgi:hypothetical protein